MYVNNNATVGSRIRRVMASLFMSTTVISWTFIYLLDALNFISGKQDVTFK